MRIPGVLVLLLCGLATTAAARAGNHPQTDAPPRILLDQPLRAVEYQLNRLSNEQLLRVERRADDPRYRPVYMALLTRAGLTGSDRESALAALVTMTGASAAELLIGAIDKVPAEEVATAAQLMRMLFARPAEELARMLASTAGVPAPDGGTPSIATGVATPGVLRAAYGARMLADGDPAAAWQAAAESDGHLQALLESVPLLPAGPRGDTLRSGLAALVTTALDDPSMAPAARAAAIAALAAARPDPATFAMLARHVRAGTDEQARTAAVRALLQLPDAAWPAAQAAIEALAEALLGQLAATPPPARTEPAALEALELGEQVAARLSADRARAVRRDLRALGVQVVRIETIPEQLAFTLRWFVVEAGKPVQIVLVNPDAMPHNLVIGVPGSVERIGTTGSAMPMPSDPAVKPFVPAIPEVLWSTPLLAQGETARLAFEAPAEPGPYTFVCTFPGHWLRMYGVMLVVPSLETWEADPQPPVDPMTGQPFTSERQ